MHINNHVDIQARNFSLTKALRKYIDRRLRFTLGNKDQHIQRVIVRLSDINGPRGGEDKCCQIQVILPHLKDVVVEDIETDMYVAIDRATERVSCAVGRRLSRQRDNKRTTARFNFAALTEEYEAQLAEINSTNATKPL